MLKKVETEYRKINPDFRINIVVCECLFGIEDNGTDMPFFHKDSVKCPEVIEKLK